MKIAILLLLYVCLSLPMITPQQDKGWRGIAPLHSTRADVERLLGKPDMQGDRYDYEDERVSIFYQRHTCEESKGEGFNVPIDTVLFISVNFKNTDRSLSDFPVDWTQYEKKEGGHVIGYAYYTNRDKGISYETYNGKVVAVEYGWTTADAHLRCPTSAAKQPCDKARRQRQPPSGGRSGASSMSGAKRERSVAPGGRV